MYVLLFFVGYTCWMKNQLCRKWLNYSARQITMCNVMYFNHCAISMTRVISSSNNRFKFLQRSSRNQNILRQFPRQYRNCNAKLLIVQKTGLWVKPIRSSARQYLHRDRALPYIFLIDIRTFLLSVRLSYIRRRRAGERHHPSGGNPPRSGVPLAGAILCRQWWNINTNALKNKKFWKNMLQIVDWIVLYSRSFSTSWCESITSSAWRRLCSISFK